MLKDKGFDIVYDSNTSIFAPKGVPKEVMTILQEAIKKTLEDPKVKAEFEKVNLQMGYDTPENVQKELDAENQKSSVILKKLNLLK